MKTNPAAAPTTAAPTTAAAAATPPQIPRALLQRNATAPEAGSSISTTGGIGSSVLVRIAGGGRGNGRLLRRGLGRGDDFFTRVRDGSYVATEEGGGGDHSIESPPLPPPPTLHSDEDEKDEDSIPPATPPASSDAGGVIAVKRVADSISATVTGRRATTVARQSAGVTMEELPGGVGDGEAAIALGAGGGAAMLKPEFFEARRFSASGAPAASAAPAAAKTRRPALVRPVIRGGDAPPLPVAEAAAGTPPPVAADEAADRDGTPPPAADEAADRAGAPPPLPVAEAAAGTPPPVAADEAAARAGAPPPPPAANEAAAGALAPQMRGGVILVGDNATPRRARSFLETYCCCCSTKNNIAR